MAIKKAIYLYQINCMNGPFIVVVWPLAIYAKLSAVTSIKRPCLAMYCTEALSTLVMYYAVHFQFSFTQPRMSLVRPMPGMYTSLSCGTLISRPIALAAWTI